MVVWSSVTSRDQGGKPNFEHPPSIKVLKLKCRFFTPLYLSRFVLALALQSLVAPCGAFCFRVLCSVMLGLAGTRSGFQNTSTPFWKAPASWRGEWCSGWHSLDLHGHELFLRLSGNELYRNFLSQWKAENLFLVSIRCRISRSNVCAPCCHLRLPGREANPSNQHKPTKGCLLWWSRKDNSYGNGPGAENKILGPLVLAGYFPGQVLKKLVMSVVQLAVWPPSVRGHRISLHVRQGCVSICSRRLCHRTKYRPRSSDSGPHIFAIRQEAPMRCFIIVPSWLFTQPRHTPRSYNNSFHKKGTPLVQPPTSGVGINREKHGEICSSSSSVRQAGPRRNDKKHLVSIWFTREGV